MGPCARGRPSVLAALTVLLAVRGAAPASAQTVEVAPFAGYRFGGDLFELATNHPQDLDGAPVFGGAVSVEMANGLWFEALFTHQQADVDIRRRAVQSAAFEPGRSSITGWPAAVRTSVRAVRGRSSPGSWGSPTTGPTATTRSGSRSAAAGASSSPLARHLGLRLDGRVFTTFVDVDAAAACAGGCIVGLNVNVVWQAEFTAGLVLVF